MNIIDVVNTIRDNASQTYQDRIPAATRKNIEDVQAAMTDPANAVVANEFMSTLLNMIIKQAIHVRMFENPLKMLKKGKKPLGDTIEEIYTNFIKAQVYSQTGSALLNRNLPDTKTVWHRMNRQDQYKVTVNYQSLYKAFASWEKLDTYVSSIINTLYNSAELDEFILTKELFAQAAENKAIVQIVIDDPLASKDNGAAFIKVVKTISGGMTFPSDAYNAYLTAQSEDNNAIVTLSRKDEQVLILSNAVDVSVNVDVLATVFNMSVAEFNETRKIVVDEFPDPNFRAALVDEAFFQIYDDLEFFNSFDNPEGLYQNYYYNIWQTLAYSPLVNAVVFTTLIPIGVTSAAGTNTGYTAITVDYTLGTGQSYKYKVGNTAAEVITGEVYSDGWTSWDGDDEIVAATDKVITIVAVDTNGKAVAAGHATVVAHA